MKTPQRAPGASRALSDCRAPPEVRFGCKGARQRGALSTASSDRRLMLVKDFSSAPKSIGWYPRTADPARSKSSSDLRPGDMSLRSRLACLLIVTRFYGPALTRLGGGGRSPLVPGGPMPLSAAQLARRRRVLHLASFSHSAVGAGPPRRDCFATSCIRTSPLPFRAT